MKHIYLAGLSVVLASAVSAAEPTEAMASYADVQVNDWLTNPVVIDAIRAQNAAHANLTQADIDAMDQQWRAQIGEGDQPLIDSVRNTAASAFLRDNAAATEGVVTEVFVMDMHGLNVAMSAVTSDYWQGDEAKFTQTYAVGPGAVHISPVELDESTQTYQAQVSVSIADPDSGEVIGAVTFGINAQSFF